MIYNKILAEKQNLDNQISLLEQKISELPDGNLHYAHDKGRIKWFHSSNSQNTYIPKKDAALAEKLAYKKYLSHLLTDCRQEQKAINQYLKHHTDASAEAFASHPIYQQLLPASCLPISSELAEWVQAPYEKNMNYPEQLTYRAVSGNMVRSKSEVLIDMFLSTNQIPFRYECALMLGDRIIYPDFTIRHPKTGDTLYWEHFGMMDILSYCKQAFSKLQLYGEYMILPDHQLITTFESKKKPLSTDEIESAIRRFLL